MGDSDSEEDLDEDGAAVEEEENEGSVIIDNGSNSDSSKEVDARLGSIAGGELGAGSVDQGSSGNGSEEEGTEESLKSLTNLDGCDADSKNKDNLVIESHDGSKDYNAEVPSKSHSNEVNEAVGQQPGTSASEVEVVSAAEVRDCSASESVSVSAGESPQDIEKPLNFDDYHSVAELEVYLMSLSLTICSIFMFFPSYHVFVKNGCRKTHPLYQ